VSCLWWLRQFWGSTSSVSRKWRRDACVYSEGKLYMRIYEYLHLHRVSKKICALKTTCKCGVQDCHLIIEKSYISYTWMIFTICVSRASPTWMRFITCPCSLLQGLKYTRILFYSTWTSTDLPQTFEGDKISHIQFYITIC